MFHLYYLILSRDKNLSVFLSPLSCAIPVQLKSYRSALVVQSAVQTGNKNAKPVSSTEVPYHTNRAIFWGFCWINRQLLDPFMQIFNFQAIFTQFELKTWTGYELVSASTQTDHRHGSSYLWGLSLFRWRNPLDVGSQKIESILIEQSIWFESIETRAMF